MSPVRQPERRDRISSASWPQPFRGARRAAAPACAGLILLAMSLPARPAAQASSKNQPSSRPAETASAGEIQAGMKIFTKDGCYECHGREGQGASEAAGPRIGPPRLTLDAFTAYVRHPSNQMPPYTDKVISDKELADIYAYLQSRPKPRPAKDVPLLNQ